MGWLGTLFVGAVVGIVGLVMQGRWRAPRFWVGVGAAALCALLVKMLGNITGVLVDGASLEWLAAVVAAIAAVAAFGALAMRAPPRPAAYEKRRMKNMRNADE
ncbi:hypothetical protein OVY01_13440 [Robbsia sp. Bb-Pol-6]|uniref:GlsB/YeaQ/YmgE family stress response membrane protein n=1 Tax=Robbsia betulipollinis TaxID=2981849 RepID=A0ABT3ZP92_9BURK|nr:hypothetical protein [Robbsia betulipollinis]MCY0388222.1 hypothetical protein [Robbsia betulipollinis]